jgi:peptidoglycan/xylan/chitin deacetylase (PgdA/CDA1 family)
MHELDLRKFSQDGGFVSLCYHYIQSNSERYPYKLLGTYKDDFALHVKWARKAFRQLLISEVSEHEYSRGCSNGVGMIFTFDDGLSDHIAAGEILADAGISGLFFVPTCLLTDNLPPNPTVIHYGLAAYGLDRFLKAYRHALETNRLSVDRYDIQYFKGETDPWGAIRAIKQRTKYDLDHKDSREVLMHIYRDLLLKDNENILSQMHMSEHEVKRLLAMGHRVGTHSHTHLSVAASDLNREDFYREIIKPRKILERLLGTHINTLAYPFGGRNDCFSESQLCPEQSGYDFAFTVDPKLNTEKTNQFSFGRYMPTSKDTIETINGVLSKMILSQGANVLFGAN